jgi:hypothetical protein
MTKYSGIPEMLEAYMEENAADERWITVHEFREFYSLARYQSNTVSAFLRRLEFGPFGRFPFIVAKITREAGANPSDPRKCRYLLKRRDHPPALQRQIRYLESTPMEPAALSLTGNRENPV